MVQREAKSFVILAALVVVGTGHGSSTDGLKGALKNRRGTKKMVGY